MLNRLGTRRKHDAMDRRVAIILHGPPCTGKTAIAGELQRRVSARLISLDDGWLRGEFRHSGGERRYADLARAPEPVLIVEIGCGEPPDLGFYGATRGADEWVRVVRGSVREIFPFLLVTDHATALARIEQRLNERIRSGSTAAESKLFLMWQFVGLHSLHEHGDPRTAFPPMPNLTERRLVTSVRTASAFADEILCAVGAVE